MEATASSFFILYTAHKLPERGTYHDLVYYLHEIRRHGLMHQV